MKVLLVRTSSMGDLIHTFYAIDDLARYRPEVELHWICEESFINIPRLHPFVKKIITFSWREYRQRLHYLDTWVTINKIKKELRTEKYDMVVDSQGLIKSALIARLTKSSVYGFDKDCIREKFACRFYSYSYHISEKDNIIWKNRQLFSLIFNYRDQITREKYNTHLEVPQEIQLDFLEQDKFHVVVQGASQDYKLWYEDCWRELLQKKYSDDKFPVLLTWGNQKEYAANKRIAEGFDFVYICPKMNLTQVAKLINLSVSVISVDTGLLHLANALNKPTVGIYPNSSVNNTQVEGRSWEIAIGGINAKITVDEIYQAWKKVIAEKN